MKTINPPTIALPKIYRHFAIVTVAITTLTAVFANGESRDAVTGVVAEREQHNRLKRIDEEKYGKPVLKMGESRSGKGGGRFASDSDVDGGSFDGGGWGASSRGSYAGGPQMIPAGYRHYGVSDEQLAQLSPEERAAFLERLREAREGSSPQDRQRNLDQMMAASAQRSGNSGND